MGHLHEVMIRRYKSRWICSKLTLALTSLRMLYYLKCSTHILGLHKELLLEQWREDDLHTSWTTTPPGWQQRNSHTSWVQKALVGPWILYGKLIECLFQCIHIQLEWTFQ